MPINGRSMFAQTELEVHDAWGLLTTRGPQYARAAALLHQMVARMDKQSALVASREVLAEIAHCSVSTVRRSLSILKESNWIDIVPLGKGGTNAYLINSRVAWRNERKLLSTASFTATVMASVKDQEPATLDYEDDVRPALRRIASLYSNELPLPSGRGAEPPVQQALPGVENNPPALRMDEQLDQETGEILNKLRDI